MAWTPYKNVFFLAYHQVRRQAPNRPERYVRRQAVRTAHNFARKGFPSGVVRQGESWPSLDEGDAKLMSKVRVSGRLSSFVNRQGREARRTLDKLILGWTSVGKIPEVVVKEATADYNSIDYMPELEEREVGTYAALFWNFASLFDLSDGIAWLEGVGRAEDASILRGDLGLEAVRTLAGTTRGMEFEERMTRLARKSTHVLEGMLDDMIKRPDEENVLGVKLESNAGKDYYSTEHVKSVASFMASVSPLLKAYQEIDERDGEDQSLEEIVRITNERVEEERQEYKEIEQPMDDIQPDNLTAADLRAENAAIEEGQDPSIGVSTKADEDE